MSMLHVFRKVFGNVRYLSLVVMTSGIIFVFAIWLPNFRLIINILGSTMATFSQKLELLIALLGGIRTNFTPLTALYLILVSILIGINVTLIAYQWRRQASGMKNGFIGTILGSLSGILGIGCAACGTIILTGVLSALGLSSALAFLPLGGTEFGITGVVLLSASIVILSRQIEKPVVCAI